ncbi:S-layer homology domain-containing protein [Paenibacillus campi]|uniref:S-layer homology domain-containing protein n=1 Tax=Paenibacillus campi TaxID=3106031 RepID=UPI002AFE5194|nr:S-layer homology domain-containing protein [Paenibacillus sp. SGZ-1009]
MELTRNKITYVFCVLLVGVCLFTSTVQAAAVSGFKDVKSSHWAYSTIKWAVTNGIVKGYPDGTFKPNKQVSEAEFLMMFVSTYQKIDKSQVKNNWADPVYNVATSLNWPVKGISNVQARNTPMTRGEVADLIVSAQGINFITKDAVRYLLGTGQANGKKGNTVDGYSSSDYLTRAEAVAFIKKAKDAGLAELKARPDMPTSTDIIPTVQETPSNLKGAKAAIDAAIKNYPGYYTRTNSDDVVNVYNPSGKVAVSYETATSAGQNNQVMSFTATDATSIKVMVSTLKAVGIDVPSNLESVLKAAVQDGKDRTVTAGSKTLTIHPHSTNMDTIYVDFK